jgi:hypothetical protein
MVGMPPWEGRENFIASGCPKRARGNNRELQTRKLHTTKEKKDDEMLSLY